MKNLVISFQKKPDGGSHWWEVKENNGKSGHCCVYPLSSFWHIAMTTSVNTFNGHLCEGQHTKHEKRLFSQYKQGLQSPSQRILTSSAAALSWFKWRLTKWQRNKCHVKLTGQTRTALSRELVQTPKITEQTKKIHCSGGHTILWNIFTFLVVAYWHKIFKKWCSVDTYTAQCKCCIPQEAVW